MPKLHGLLLAISTATGVAALVLGTSGAGETATGVGAVVGVPSLGAAGVLEVISVVTGLLATADDCTSNKTAECAVGIVAATAGIGGLGAEYTASRGFIRDDTGWAVDFAAGSGAVAASSGGLLYSTFGAGK